MDTNLNKRTNKHTNKHTNKRTNKRTSKNANKRTSKRRDKRRDNRKIESTAKYFGLDLTIFIHILEDYAKQNNMTIMDALNYIKTQPEIIENIEMIQQHSYLLFLQAHKIINNHNNTYFSEELYNNFIKYLNTKLSDIFSSEKILQVDDTSIDNLSNVAAVAAIYSETGFKDDIDTGLGSDSDSDSGSQYEDEDDSDNGEEYGSEDIEDIKDIDEVEEDIEEFLKGSSLTRQVSVGYFNQQSIGNCGYMVYTRIFMKIIEVFYFSLTGRPLTSVKINNNPYLQYIFTINNVFIMQYLGTYEKQTRYLAYLTHKYFDSISRSEESITENDLFVYIFIRFYLFMFILSLTDDISKIISPSSDAPWPSCPLSYNEACLDPNSLAKRGFDMDIGYNLSNTLINLLFPTHIDSRLFNVPEYLITNYTSEEAFQYCLSLYPSSLSSEEKIRRCGISPLKYIPSDVISGFLNPLFNLIISQNPSDKRNVVKMLSYTRISNDIDDENTWFKYDYTNIQSYQNVEPEEIDEPEPPNTHGDKFYEMIKNELLSSKEQTIYLSIHVELNRIIGFEDRITSLHSFHAMFILFKNITGDSGNPNIQLSLQNSWGEDLAEQNMTPELFIQYINDGTIFAFSYFQLWSIVKDADKWDFTRLQGGLKKNKTKKRLYLSSSSKKSRRRNINK